MNKIAFFKMILFIVFFLLISFFIGYVFFTWSNIL
jgi:hypothetical protein